MTSSISSDLAGNKLSAKACVACPAGTKVITSGQVIAGKTYTADLTSCQACPDPLMSMSFSQSVYSCSCPSGYTLGTYSMYVCMYVLSMYMLNVSLNLSACSLFSGRS